MQILPIFISTIFCPFPALQGRVLANISDAPYGLRLFLKGGRVHDILVMPYRAKVQPSHWLGEMYTSFWPSQSVSVSLS